MSVVFGSDRHSIRRCSIWAGSTAGGTPRGELPTRIVLGVAVLVNRPAPSYGAPVAPPPPAACPRERPAWRCAAISIGRWSPAAATVSAASASCTFCIPAMAALGGRPFLGRRSLLYAGARRLSSVAVWPGAPSGPGAAFGSREAHNWLPKPARPTTFLILVGARRRVAGVASECVGGLSLSGRARRLLVFASALHAASPTC